MKQPEKLNEEIKSFLKVWEKGYFEGDPEEVMSTSTYNVQGYISVLHAVYLMCIKPNLSPELKVLEIGPGRGAWTKTFRTCKEVYALDALSAEHNSFWEYVGNRKNFHYFQVEDFSCKMLPDDYFDFFFSFGTFCHISFDGTTAYMQNIFKKMKRGSKGYLMIADYEKYNNSIRNLDKLSVVRASGRVLFDNNPVKDKLLGLLMGMINKIYSPPVRFMDINEDEDNKKEARWYHSGTKKTCRMLEETGYHVISEDIGVLQRDPIIFFEKQ